MSTELPGGLTWVKATASNDKGACVEVAKLPDGGRAVRHSQDPDGPMLRYTEAEWTAFLDGARKGEFG
ncbi:protein of unknown function (DUF397) [Parafrankia irregularis]|uniref:DUF397 domain-containing protein n=1 Tax=Parafrankia irregularis TaxID=795642 RepID=A0A0S4QWM3_9ACTN|nr:MULTISPECIES: DUF397 domain-containing protein [Frankiaceae]KPM50818.1 hypothetical protein ACG83_37995 [Frankia sp. R43]MBE3204847.1 DUF397 domain-containing protein [Parafrankia sp. CH37]CUU59192.1 protein of unknown function (DUF397) [Parafrankia irregularis]